MLPANPPPPSCSIRAKMETLVRKTQEEVCAAIEQADGRGKFRTDAWVRNGGGGGISKVPAPAIVFTKSNQAQSRKSGILDVCPGLLQLAYKQNSRAAAVCNATCAWHRARFACLY